MIGNIFYKKNTEPMEVIDLFEYFFLYFLLISKKFKTSKTTQIVIIQSYNVIYKQKI